MTTLAINLAAVVKLTDDDFYTLCVTNPDLQFERTTTGELIVMSPLGGESSKREADLITDLNIWNRQTELGIVFSSSGGFKLPNGAERSPDAAWVKVERWQQLTLEQRRRFPPIAPDFVIELRSASDDLAKLQDKMQEYLDNGVRLGWLINPQSCQVEIYRLGQPKEVLTNPQFLSGEDVLPGFLLDLTRIF